MGPGALNGIAMAARAAVSFVEGAGQGCRTGDQHQQQRPRYHGRHQGLSKDDTVEDKKGSDTLWRVIETTEVVELDA